MLEGRQVEVIFGQKLGKKTSIPGRVVGAPVTTENLSNILVPEEKNAVIFIRLLGEVPKKYYIYGYPVKVRLKDN